MSDTRIGVVGCAGRMGLALAREIAGSGDCIYSGGAERPGHGDLGADIGTLAGLGASGHLVGGDAGAIFEMSDVVIDFTAPQATNGHAAIAQATGTALVTGTTGLEPQHLKALEQAGGAAAVVWAANMSLGINLLAALTRRAAKVLGEDFDIEILEMHHRHKLDAPSGTALALGEAAAKGRGRRLDDIAVRGRDGWTGERRTGDIGFAVLRGGNVAGEHSVIFAAEDERIELTHRAGDRSIFARGAVRAAKWAAKAEPGFYGMSDVLGLNL